VFIKTDIKKNIFLVKSERKTKKIKNVSKFSANVGSTPDRRGRRQQRFCRRNVGKLDVSQIYFYVVMGKFLFYD